MGARDDAHRGGHEGAYLSTTVQDLGGDTDSDWLNVTNVDRRSLAEFVCVQWKQHQSYTEEQRGWAYAFTPP